MMGNKKAALETQKEFGGTMAGMADTVPLLGHAKGLCHLVSWTEIWWFVCIESWALMIGITCSPRLLVTKKHAMLP